MFNGQLLIGTLIVIALVIFHVVALFGLNLFLRQRVESPTYTSGMVFDAMLLAFVVLIILIIHTLEASIWAAVYYYLGEFSDLTTAMYFSVVTATTLGYGDITLSAETQLLGSFEAMGGLILFGASTAFLFEVMRHFMAGPSSR